MSKAKKTKNHQETSDGVIRSLGKGIVSFPSSLLEPVATFLQEQLKKLEKTKKTVAKDDPFRNSSRVADNAAPDTEADEQFGHAKTSAIKEQLDRRIIQTRKALSMIKIGKYGICEDCGNMIDTDRLMIYPDATLCAKDQGRREK